MYQQFSDLNWFDQTPDSAYLREWQLIGKRNKPGIPKLIPVSRATLWRMIKAGRFPAPHKLGPNTSAWNCGEVRSYLKRIKV